MQLQVRENLNCILSITWSRNLLKLKYIHKNNFEVLGEVYHSAKYMFRQSAVVSSINVC